MGTVDSWMREACGQPHGQPRCLPLHCMHMVVFAKLITVVVGTTLRIVCSLVHTFTLHEQIECCDVVLATFQETAS